MNAPLRKAPLMVISYNVRGLNDQHKARHLVNYLYKVDKGKEMDLIAGFQETYISRVNSLNYLWRGNLFFTEGNGNSCGCVTFLSPHLNVLVGKSIGDRAHVIVLQKSGDTSATYIVANIYAPNPNTNVKIEFFEKIFETINEYEEQYNCSNVIVLGDFNLTFKAVEMKNRAYNSQEKKVALEVKIMIESNNLTDIWEGGRSFTWKRANSDTFSVIDRVLFSKAHLELNEKKVNWGVSSSDHGAVETMLSFKNVPPKIRSRLARIDPSLARNQDTATKLVEDFNEMLNTMPGHWNPHCKLEFAKVCIRTVAERIQAERKRTELTEEDELNIEINDAIAALAKATDGRRITLIEDIEELRAKKAAFIEEKGKRLAEKLGTKWYNEGEKSTRYFMRLLNRTVPDDIKNINVDGRNVQESDEISSEIVKFYKNLYENYERIETADDSDFFRKIVPMSEGDEGKVVEPMTLEELRKTLHTCKDSAPGPDGIPYSVIGLLWSSFGPILLESWQHSLATGKLAPSHKVSYLKLIPKAGKDLTKLTNWRPITLSNCDHKLITKSYSIRMSENVMSKICGNQTAYLSGRLINDNVRAIDGTIRITNLEENAKGLLVALDAKKAFDSVDHNYIEQCLDAFGCSRFIPIFRTLYNELSTDIIINGRVTKGFLIKRGVKQGDALSCIIFIICMEPLLRNIEANEEIEAIPSATLNKTLPKVYAYADDVNATIKDTASGMQSLFNEYERLSKMSGLELNADKTELMLLGAHPEEKSFNVNYLNQTYSILSNEKIKVNGIFFQRNERQMRMENVDSVLNKIDKCLKQWSRRSLSTLGKILILKTFGISQIIYLMQSMCLENVHYKKLNAMLYKFIWNRHYQAAKAPERVKREIVNTPLKLGGFGMLDIIALDDSIKIKALARLMSTQHPFLSIIKERINLDQFFYPRIETGLDDLSSKGIVLLTGDRTRLWEINALDTHRDLLNAVGDTGIKNLVSERGRTSIPFYMLWARGARYVKDLNSNGLSSIERYIEPNKIKKLALAIRTRSGNVERTFLETYFVKDRSKPLSKLSTKEIRETRTTYKSIRDFKIGMNLTEVECRSWGLKLNKITSTKHKNVLLRIAHGEVYTQEKLHRFGLTESPLCPRCGMIEDLQHKFIECQYVKKIWDKVADLTAGLTTDNLRIENRSKVILGSHLNSNITMLTINAEIIQRLLSLKADLDYVLHPKIIVKQVIAALHMKERNKTIKTDLKSILDALTT